MDASKLKQAQAAYKSLCGMLDGLNWKYRKDDEKLTIYSGAQGDDLPIDIRIEIDAERMLVMLLSELPFKASEKSRVNMALAVSVANYGMVDGSFDYDFLSGSLLFRMTSCYRDCLISQELLKYMLMCACFTIDHYNDKFLEVSEKEMTPAQVLAFIKK